MAALEAPMASSFHNGLPEWRRDDTRNIRSNAKAERILGLSEVSGPYSQEKKRMGFNFSFSDLRDVFPGFGRKQSRPNLQIRAFDMESIPSNPSPTFDPSASTTSLNTTDSSPTITKRRPEQSHIIHTAERFSQAETLRVHKMHMPTVDEQNELKQLMTMEFAHMGLKSEESTPPVVKRKRSAASVVSLFSETAPMAFQFSEAPVNGNSLVARIAQSAKTTRAESPEEHVQNWLHSARLDRRPSRSSSLPAQSLSHRAGVSSCGESIQTLIPESRDRAIQKRSSPPQWPLPATKITLPNKSKRISKRDLYNESVLLWSSDEEDSDGELPKRRSVYSSARNSKSSCSGRVSRLGHQRQESNASSVIQLDSRPWIRPVSTLPSRTFPKRSLADIAATGASKTDSGESWETDIPADLDMQSVTFEGTAMPEHSNPSDESSLITTTHPLWRTSTGSGDIDIRISRPTAALQTLVEEQTSEAAKKVEEDGILDVSSFPVPPRSRSASIVPSIQVHSTDGTQKLVQASTLAYPNSDGVLLAPSVKSRSGSVDSQNSMVSSKSSQGLPAIPKPVTGSEPLLDITRRKRTISNVPIYVTGLESSATDHDESTDNVKSYVFSSIF